MATWNRESQQQSGGVTAEQERDVRKRERRSALESPTTAAVAESVSQSGKGLSAAVLLVALTLTNSIELKEFDAPCLL